MVKLNNFQEIKSVILDTDVIVNWLTKEVETTTKKNLWSAPYKIITHKLKMVNLKGFFLLPQF